MPKNQRQSEKGKFMKTNMEFEERLLESASDLLAALKVADKFISPSGFQTKEAYVEARTMIQEAIRKAEGLPDPFKEQVQYARK